MALYSKAPIVEAALDIKIRCKTFPTLQMLEAFGEQERDKFPKKRTAPSFAFRFVGGESEGYEGAPLDASSTGFAFMSEEENRIVQARIDSFSFNWLRPYDRWETFRDEAKRLWRKYRDLTKPDSIELIGLNYVNRIDFPNESEISDYLRASPNLPPELPAQIDSFNMSVLLPTDDDSSLNIVVGSTPPEVEGTKSVILDIQVYESPLSEISEDQLWEKFEQYRIKKNEVFEACIREKVREMIR